MTQVRNSFIAALLFSLVQLSGCSPKVAPYENGPVMGQKEIADVFDPILAFMEYQPGMSFADVGAGSGALTIMMSTRMRNSVVHIQDIDTAVLKKSNVDKMIDFYSQKNAQDFRTINSYHLTIGSTQRTNLPDHSFDRIYSNATVHNFTALDSMMVDLGKKLTPNGVLFLRDSFKNDHGEGEFCSDPKCGNRLLTIDEFLAVMERNGFKLVKRNPDLSGYPVFGFSVAK